MRYIPFDEIMKEPNNWDDEIDIDIMNENHELLKPIINKFFFREMPDNPKVFSLIFSNREFTQTLINGMKQAGMKELDMVVFCEYKRIDKEKLAELGILRQKNLDIPTVIYTRGENTFFVNLFL